MTCNILRKKICPSKTRPVFFIDIEFYFFSSNNRWESRISSINKPITIFTYCRYNIFVSYNGFLITNTINIFQPDILCIGGGVCNEGDNLLLPLKKLVSESIYSKNSAKNTEICICSLGNDAGIIGAAMLGKSPENSGLLKNVFGI